MPRCGLCGRSTSSEELRVVGEGLDQTVACRGCRSPHIVEDPMSNKIESVPVSDIFSVRVMEYQTEDGGKDHRIRMEGSFGGLSIHLNTTIDQIRRFFSEKRERGKKANLSVV